MNESIEPLPTGREELIALESEEQYVFHGSADGAIEILEPRQSSHVIDSTKPTEKINDGKRKTVNK